MVWKINTYIYTLYPILNSFKFFEIISFLINYEDISMEQNYTNHSTSKRNDIIFPGKQVFISICVSTHLLDALLFSTFSYVLNIFINTRFDMGNYIIDFSHIIAKKSIRIWYICLIISGVVLVLISFCLHSCWDSLVILFHAAPTYQYFNATFKNV